MTTDCGKSYTDLQRELDSAKDALVALNDNIKRIVGRNNHAKDSSGRSDKKFDSKHNSDQHDIKIKVTQTVSNRRSYNDSKSVFDRLSSPSSQKTPHRLTSRVIRELPSRQEIVAAQGVDSESRARNRRMFGSLLGTLHKFCQEESRKDIKQKEEKKAQIEKKVEQQELRERQTLRKETESLFQNRKRKQLEIKTLEQKLSRVKDFEAWEGSMNNLKPFIKTKTSPSVYYKPKVFTKKTEKLLADCQNEINKRIQERKEALNHDLTALEETLNTTDLDADDTNCVERYDLPQPQRKRKSTPVSNNNNNGTLASIIREGKSGPDFKENKVRKLSEPALNSVVVKH